MACRLFEMDRFPVERPAMGAGMSSRSVSMMVTRGYAFAPPAFRPFCARQPRLCNTRGRTKLVTLTPGCQAELEAVNGSVNHRIKERSDLDSVGGADDWRVPTEEGDCEDFAILKKSELLNRGWPASALLLTVVALGGAGHTVLTVRTDKGDLIMNNRSSAVRIWSRTSHRYFARQSQSENGKWMRIEPLAGSRRRQQIWPSGELESASGFLAIATRLIAASELATSPNRYADQRPSVRRPIHLSLAATLCCAAVYCVRRRRRWYSYDRCRPIP